MIMFKALGRFLLLLFVCLLLVYAPEILSGVSVPYSLKTTQRALLRIALCCEDEQDCSSLYAAINDYQKAHAHIHFRLTRIGTDQLRDMQAPYPDILLVSRDLAHAHPSCDILGEYASLLCILPSGGEPSAPAAEFSSYLFSSNPTAAQHTSSDF